MRKVIFIGAGQYSKVVASSLPKKYKLVGFIDEGRTGTHIGKPILGSSIYDIKNYKKYLYFVTLGEVEPRKKWFDILQKENLNVINIIDKSAYISKDVKYGVGNYFGRNVVVNNCCTIGDDNMFNTNSIIEHHCRIGSHCRIAPSATLCGVVTVEDSVFIGSNSTFIGCQKIGKHAVIGAGSVVLKNVEENNTVVGVPCRVVKEDNR